MEDPEKQKNPASLICFRYTHRALSTAPDLKLFKNLVKSKQTELDLSNNCIETEIKNLSNLKYLRKLSLASNHLTELWTFPPTLEYLNLSCNHISYIPELKLPRLIYLDLSCNLIARLECLLPFQQVRTLYLSYNLIRELRCLVDFPNLVELDLEHNMLNSLESVKGLIENEHLMVFIIKNNPIYRNHVFCKDFFKAASLNCRLIREGFGGSSTETNRMSRIYSEYTNYVAQKDVIREQDEYNDALVNEVEELRKIVSSNENQKKSLQNTTLKGFKSAFLMERQLMRHSELEREQVMQTSRIRKVEKSEYNYRAKYNLLCTTNKKLEQNFKDLRSEMEKLSVQLNSAELEKYRLQSDLVYLSQENETLRNQVSSFSQQFLFLGSNNPSVGNKKVMKCKSTKSFCKSTVPNIRMLNKDSIVISPISNATLPTVTQASKRKNSDEIEHSKMLMGMPTKGKTVTEKPLRIKKRSFNS